MYLEYFCTFFESKPAQSGNQNKKKKKKKKK